MWSAQPDALISDSVIWPGLLHRAFTQKNAARERNSRKSINTWKWEQEADDGFICAPRSQTVEPTYVSTSVWSCQPLSLETTSQLGPFLELTNRHIYQSRRTSPTPRSRRCQGDKHWDVDAVPLVSPAADLRRSCFLVFSWRAHHSCYFWTLLTERCHRGVFLRVS